MNSSSGRSHNLHRCKMVAVPTRHRVGTGALAEVDSLVTTQGLLAIDVEVWDTLQDCVSSQHLVSHPKQ